MAVTTASDLASGQIAMVAAARYTYEHTNVCHNLFDRRELAPGEKSLFIPKFGRVEAADLTDGVDMTESQTLSITGTTHTTDEAGLRVVITKKLRHQLKEDAYAACGRVESSAISRKIDKDGLALFSGLNSGVGATATTLTLGYLAAAIAQCKGQSEPVPGPLYCVHHPYTLNAIVDMISYPSTNNMPPDMQAEFLREYWRGTEKLYGVPIFGAGNITIDSADDAYGALFSKMAFIYLVGWDPETEVEYDASLRGWEMVVVADYGMVEEDGGYGRYLLFDAAAPTS